jgi:hypothetical protein
LRHWRWAAAAAEEHATMASASALLKPRGNYYDARISVGKDGERGCVQCKGHMSTAMARRKGYHSGGGSGADAMMVRARQEQGDNGMAPDRHRQGKGNATMALPKR